MSPPGYQTYVEVTEISKGLCAEFRPEHFRGVATVVSKLFDIDGETLEIIEVVDRSAVIALAAIIGGVRRPIDNILIGR